MNDLLQCKICIWYRKLYCSLSLFIVYCSCKSYYNIVGALVLRCGSASVSGHIMVEQGEPLACSVTAASHSAFGTLAHSPGEECWNTRDIPISSLLCLNPELSAPSSQGGRVGRRKFHKPNRKRCWRLSNSKFRPGPSSDFLGPCYTLIRVWWLWRMSWTRILLPCQWAAGAASKSLLKQSSYIPFWLASAICERASPSGSNDWLPRSDSWLYNGQATPGPTSAVCLRCCRRPFCSALHLQAPRSQARSWLHNYKRLSP